MPGVGKSQLAVEFAYRYAYQFEKGVYWIRGADPTTCIYMYDQNGYLYPFYRIAKLMGVILDVFLSFRNRLFKTD